MKGRKPTMLKQCGQNSEKNRNDVTREICKAKTQYKNKLIDKSNDNNISVKTWFKMSKQLMNKKGSSNIPTLVEDSTEASTDLDKTNLLNKYFCKQSTIDDSGHNLPFTGQTVQLSKCINIINKSPQDVQDAISTVDPSMACGPDLISPKLL